MAAGEGRVLVTGANGFIGSALVDLLVAMRTPIVAVARGDAANLRHHAGSGLVEIVDLDLGDDHAVRDLAATVRPTAAFHLAWRSPPDYMTSVSSNLESLRIGISVIDALLDAECPRLVVAGSCAEYRLGPEVLVEDATEMPGSLYGVAKRTLGDVGVRAAAASGATLAWARIFYVFGPREASGRAVPQMLAAARAGTTPTLHKPDQRRDFLHVDDVAGALHALAEASAHGAHNVCAGSGVTLRELWREIAALEGSTGGELDAPVTDEPPIVGDASKLRSLGWAPTRSLSAGLEAAAAWWRAQDA